MAGVKYEFSYVFGEAFQPPQQQDWTLYRNTSFELDLDVVDDQEQPVDLTGWCAELIIEYICAFEVDPPGRGKIIKYKLIANRTTDTQYFNTKYGSFVVDDANGNIKFKLTSFGTSKDNTNATFFDEAGLNRLVQVEGPLLCNEAKYELRFKYTDPESNDDTYLRPLFGNITFVNTHVSTEDQLPCEDKTDIAPVISALNLLVKGDPLLYTSGDDLLISKILFTSSTIEFLHQVLEKAVCYRNNTIIGTASSDFPLRRDGGVDAFVDASVFLTDNTVIDGDEIKIVFLTNAGQQLETNSFIVSGNILEPRTLYYNHNETTASWNKLEYWYEDENFQIPASDLPRSIDTVIVTSSVNYPLPVEVYSLTVNGPQFSPLIYRVPTAANNMTFNNYAVVKADLFANNITFNDNSEAGANIAGTVAVPISINITPITISFNNTNNGSLVFNDNSKNYARILNSPRNIAIFNYNSQNSSTTIYDSVSLTSPLEGYIRCASFYGVSKNYGIIGGRVAGSINVRLCFGTSCRSARDKSIVTFYDNSCHVGDINLLRLPARYTQANALNPPINESALDEEAISPYPPPTCIS